MSEWSPIRVPHHCRLALWSCHECLMVLFPEVWIAVVSQLQEGSMDCCGRTHSCHTEEPCQLSCTGHVDQSSPLGCSTASPHAASLRHFSNCVYFISLQNTDNVVFLLPRVSTLSSFLSLLQKVSFHRWNPKNCSLEVKWVDIKRLSAFHQDGCRNLS